MNNKKGNVAFITGITGQDGSYLTEFLIEKGYKVYGIVRRTSSLYNDDRLKNVRKYIILRYGDMTDGAALQNYIHEIIDENSEMERFEIYNLAAQSHVKISFEIPEYTSLVDGIGTLKLLEIFRTLPKEKRDKCRFYQAGTSEMYGKVLETPQSETTPFNPVSPYAAAKVYAHYLVKIYREGYGLFACNGILFNHESPRRGQNFLTMKVINGVKDILTEKKALLQVGNLDSKRDWGHAKDYVRGMWLMMQQDKSDDYVLATGKTTTVRDFITKAFKFKGVEIKWEGKGINEVGKNKEGKVLVKVNEKFYRPCEVNLLLGNPKKAKSILGWKREFDSLDLLIEDMFIR
jgi:GDPmannose 4,6-dehydratase